MSKQTPTLPRESARRAEPQRRPLWPLYLALAALALIAAGAFALTRPPSAAPAPGAAPAAGAQITLDQEQIDFGDVKVNKMVEAAFLISNTGSEPLQILSQPQVRVVEGC